MEDAVVATGMFYEIIYNCANITADNKILYVPVGWEGWLFIAAYSKLALKLLHQLTLSFLGGMGEVSYNNISMRLTQ